MPSRLTVVLVSLLLASPALIFWLWLVIVPARAAILCFNECECDVGGYYVECGSTSVDPIPLIHVTNVQVLRFYKSKINLLEKDSFVSMTELFLLHISFCGLRTIEFGAFNGLTKLTKMSLEGNNISDILPGTFENMISLEYLDLRLNKIKHLNSSVFSGLGAFNGLTNLTYLSMDGNEIREIVPGSFENMSCLENLQLGNNKLQHVDSDVFSGLSNLKYINLSGNILKNLHPYTFLVLPNIKQLHLEKNGLFLDYSYYNISSVSIETFANVSALQLLDVSGNNLKTVDINLLRALPELSELYLNGNPLQCDCQLQEVWRRCEDRNIQTADGEEVPVCDSPSEVKGIWWGVLEKGQCLEGNMQYYGDYKNTSYSETDIGEQKYEYGKEYDEFFKPYQVLIFVVPFIFGTTGNIILLIIILFNKDMRTLPNMYILNLAISDIIYLTVLLSEACANIITNSWVTGESVTNEFMCIFISFCRRMSIGLLVYCVALYSFQRYRETVRPLQVRVSSQSKWRGIVAPFFGVWLVAALFAVPSALSKNLCRSHSSDKIITYYQRVVIFELLVSCVLPLCAIAFSYIMTARHLVENSRSISDGTQHPKLNTSRYTAKIVVGLTVVFVISYVPYHVFWSYFIWSQENIFSSNMNVILYYTKYKLRYTNLISTCFLSIHSCLNTVTPFCTSSQFRQHLKRYLTCFCKTSSPSTDFELVRRN